MVIGTATMLRNRDIAYGLVLIWAYLGILLRQTSATDGFGGRYLNIIVAVMVALVVFIVAEVAVMRRGQADRGTMHR